MAKQADLNLIQWAEPCQGVSFHDGEKKLVRLGTKELALCYAAIHSENGYANSYTLMASRVSPTQVKLHFPSGDGGSRVVQITLPEQTTHEVEILL